MASLDDILTTQKNGVIALNSLVSALQSATVLGGVLHGPTFSAYQSSAQSVSSAISTKVQFQTKEFDTNSCFDATSNYRFTPTTTGYYQISGAAGFASTVSSGFYLSIYKNGSEFKRFTSTSSSTSGVNGSALLYFNGSTDYVELYIYQASGSAASLSATAFQTYFQGSMVRGA